MAPSRPAVGRFWPKVAKSDGCWLWTGAVNNKGYGQLNVASPNGSRKSTLAHRLSWEFANGPIPPGAVIRHSCDNPRCVRPCHLSAGTQAENMADAKARGRVRKGDSHNSRTRPCTVARGEQLSTKFTTDSVREIRRRYSGGGVLQKELAAEYGVHRVTIHDIISRRTWAHVE